MKFTKKLGALLLGLAMTLSLCSFAMAAETEYALPTKSQSVPSITGISSVTVNGVNATYWRDDNTGTGLAGTTYIRATVTGTEYNLSINHEA